MDLDVTRVTCGAHYEAVEKRHVKGEHMSFGNVLSKELVGVTIPKE